MILTTSTETTEKVEQFLETMLYEWSISDIIALFALMISVLSVIFSFAALRIQKRLNTTNLQAIFYEEIFKEYLVKKIPESARKLNYGSNGVLGKSYKQINMTFLEMLEKCSYFAYSNNDFYNGLREKCEQLDEKLVIESGKVIHDRNEQKKFIYSVNEDIMDIVRYINKNYSYCK